MPNQFNRHISVGCLRFAWHVDSHARGPNSRGKLKAGNLVRTANGGTATVRWIGFRSLYAKHISERGAIRASPVRIARDAIAPGIPGEKSICFSRPWRVHRWLPDPCRPADER
ncbi:Hint domain-containing protein [Bordetella petrii]|uniref:Hint domain-containing protein n=1 Tax=Bordetella petrii TaxID=94624 RepID=UPI0038B2E4EC